VAALPCEFSGGLVIELIASAIVMLTALYLLGLATVSFLAPAHAARFLNKFAGSARAHFAEMLIRLAIGCSLLVYSPRMAYPGAFLLFGWIMIVTTVVLLLLPLRWHHRFAQKVVPPLTRHVCLFGIVSLSLGCLILFAVGNSP
jgi:hypothetical protein